MNWWEMGDTPGAMEVFTKELFATAFGMGKAPTPAPMAHWCVKSHCYPYNVPQIRLIYGFCWAQSPSESRVVAYSYDAHYE